MRQTKIKNKIKQKNKNKQNLDLPDELHKLLSRNLALCDIIFQNAIQLLSSDLHREECKCSSMFIFDVLIFLGLLMVIDIPQERGMAWLDGRFGDERICQFPLFNALKPLPVDWMYVLYLVMWSGKYI